MKFSIFVISLIAFLVAAVMQTVSQEQRNDYCMAFESEGTQDCVEDGGISSSFKCSSKNGIERTFTCEFATEWRDADEICPHMHGEALKRCDLAGGEVSDYLCYKQSEGKYEYTYKCSDVRVCDEVRDEIEDECRAKAGYLKDWKCTTDGRGRVLELDYKCRSPILVPVIFLASAFGALILVGLSVAAILFFFGGGQPLGPPKYRK